MTGKKRLGSHDIIFPVQAAFFVIEEIPSFSICRTKKGTINQLSTRFSYVNLGWINGMVY